MLGVFSNHGLLEPKELYKSPCLFSQLTDVENETRIAKKKTFSLSFSLFLNRYQMVLKSHYLGLKNDYFSKKSCQNITTIILG